MECKIIAGYPGVGKSYFTKKYSNRAIISDIDSMQFSKGSSWPRTYIEYIKEAAMRSDVVFISTHKEVRDELVNQNIWFTLVVPNKSLKREYIKRFKERGSPQQFCNVLERIWYSSIQECEEQQKCKLYTLSSGEYISDVVNIP